jgi:hypothetical protein
MKLRHRRVANGDAGLTLPLTMKFDPNNSVNRYRRRRKSSPSMMGIWSAVCYFAVCILSLIGIMHIALSSLPNQPNRRHSRNRKQSIPCADGKTWGLLDDDYCDCDDGRDEPNTSACSNILVQSKSFRCKDGVMIFASRVKDGILDCPDKTDEING